MEIEGRTITQRKAAGASLLTKIRLAARERIARSWTVGRIGGFDLTCDIRPGRRDERLEPELVLERTDFRQSIDIDGETTAIGIIARLEHVLDRMEAELEEQRRRVTDAKARLAGFEPRLGEVFPLQGELDVQARPACGDRGGPRQHRGHRQRRPFDSSISLNTVVASLLAHWQLCAHGCRSDERHRFSEATFMGAEPSGWVGGFLPVRFRARMRQDWASTDVTRTPPRADPARSDRR